MQSFIVYSLASAAILFAAILVVYLWEKFFPSSEEPRRKIAAPEGAFRAFYHLLWILLLWSGLALSIPLWISYRDQISSTTGVLRWAVIMKVAFFPILFLFLLRYGKSRGYIGWIDSLEWPDEENK